MPATDLLSAACSLYAFYASPPVAAVRKIALGGKVGRLVWTGEGKFAFGMVHVTQPYPLRRPSIRADAPGFTLRLVRPGSGKPNGAFNADTRTSLRRLASAFCSAQPLQGEARDEPTNVPGPDVTGG